MPETAWMLLGIAVGFMLREYLPVRRPPTVSERERGILQTVETVERSANTKAVQQGVGPWGNE